jgi:hypothetical protein
MSSTSNTKPPPLKAASPPSIKPESTAQRKSSLTLKPSPMAAASPPGGSPGTTTSLLSKEWVIPPRPKPGRKPATDTPPTKRKAQNRAAQRAFRERRAARVGELEEQMKLMEEEDEAEQNKLRADIDRLEKEVEQYRDELTRWVERCRGLENELALIRKDSSTDAIPLPKRSPSKQDATQPLDVDNTIGCGNCSANTNCQCLDDAFNIMNAAEVGMPHEKRPHSPANTMGPKRVKVEPTEDQEIDFTAMFASRPPPQLLRDSSVEVISVHSGEQDPCGFCSDGTPCICAEMAAEAGNQQASLQHAGLPNNTTSIPHQLSQQGFTPPPSEGDVATSLPLLRTNTTTTTSCLSGPGTCAQCRADPNSTLFCKSLAASRSLASTSTNPESSSGCCGGAGTSTTCCRTTRSTRSNPQPQTQPVPSSSITLSCADAYTTLSRHPGYERAQGDMAGWMGKLLPMPVPVPREGKPVTAMEIDAANVMTVLREFDRRFAD